MTAIRVELQLADGSFTTGMLRAGQTLRSFQSELTRTNPALAQIAANGGNVIRSIQQMDQGAKGFLGTLRDMSIVVGVASAGISKMVGAANGWAGEIVRVNAEMERLAFHMRAMSTKADPFKDAAENVRYLREQATQMPFSLGAITNSFTKLKATGIDPTDGSLKAIADGIAAFGGSDEQLNRVTVALTQMSGKGVIQMEELRQQLGEHMPNAMQLMARSMGISVAQLTKEISTGTVAAKAALAKFYDELDRTYGGSAQRMMMTFSGQMAQLKTNLQNLSTGEGGSAFFEQIKTQLLDINAFLKSEVAKTIATDIGNALGSAVVMFRDAIAWIYQFRDGLINVAQVAGAGLGLLIAGRAVSSFTSLLGGTVRQLSFFVVNMREAAANIQLGLSGFRSLGTVALGTQYAALGTAQAIGAVAASAVSIVGVLIALGGTVYFLADRFGYLTDRTKDAYEELVKYGAESRKQAAEISDAYIASLKEQIETEKKLRMERMEGVKLNEQGNLVPDDSIGNLWTLNEELRKVQTQRADLERRGAEREDDESMERLRRRLSDREELIRAERVREQLNNDKKYNDELADLAKVNKSKGQADEDYRAKKVALDNKASQEKIDLYRSEIKKLDDLSVAADEDRRRKNNKEATYLRELILEENKKIRSSEDVKWGADKLNSPDGGKKAIESGEKALERLNRDIAGLQANLAGANDAVGEMNQRIAAGDFGSIREGGEAVQELHDKLIAATEAKEILDRLSKGEKKAEEDIARIREKALEDQMNLKLRLAGGDKMTDAEKYIFKLNNGAYDGLGSSIEQIRTSIADVIKSMNLQGRASTQLGEVLRQNTFGQQSVERINTVYEAVLKLVQGVNTLGTSLNGISFQNFTTFGTGLGNAIMGGIQPVMDQLPAQVTERMKQAMSYMMQKGWSQAAAAGIVGNLVGESNMNPNAIGDNGNAFGMPQWNDRAPAMKAFLAAQGKQWNDFYGQLDFIDHELRGSEGKAGGQLSLAKDATQAAEIFMRMYERPAAWAMRESGGKRAGAAQQAYGMSGGSAPVSGPTVAAAAQLPAIPGYDAVAIEKELNDFAAERVEKTKQLVAEARKVAELEKGNVGNKAAADRKDYLDDLIAKTKNAGTDIEDLGKNFAALKTAVSTGKLGKNTDINAAEYKELVKAAKELDQVEQKMADKKKASKGAERELTDLEQKRLELNRSIAEQQKKAADPNYKADSQAINKLTTDLDEYLSKVREVYGQDSAEYKKALDYKSTMLRNQKTLDATTEQASLAKQRQDMQISLMSESQARAYHMQQDLQRLDQWVERARAAGMSEVEITEFAEKQKAQIRAKYAAEANPMTKQMQEWGDIQGNLAKASTRWMDSLAGGLTDLIMGTGDLKAVINGILKDMLNMGLKYLMSNVMGNKGGSTGGKKGATSAVSGGKKGASSASGGKKAMAAIAHTGGIIGSSNLSRRSISPAAFIGAPKFHTGGIIHGPRLQPGEVPIIAKHGEGVFTPEQMENMGGMQQNTSFQISAPVTVNGSSGTAEQNDDLAKKMAKEMEQTMRGVVADEVRRQSRPGNFLNTKSR